MALEFKRLSAGELAAWREEYTLGEIGEKNVVGAGPYGCSGDAPFIPHLQVHEFEALVLTDAARIEGLDPAPAVGISQLDDECQAYESPEDINHGHQSHPKARIFQRVPEYDENVAGPLLAHDIGLPRLRAACPHFGRWLTRLEQLDLPT